MSHPTNIGAAPDPQRAYRINAAAALLADLRSLDIGDDRATCRIIGRAEAVLEDLLNSLGVQA